MLKPNQIYEDFNLKKITSKQAIDLLISLVDDNQNCNDKKRILAIKFLGLLNFKSEKIFTFLENLLISDSNEHVRGEAANILKSKFPERAFKPIYWVLKNDNNSDCTVMIIKSLEKSSNTKLKSLLKIKPYVNYEGNIYFPSKSYPILYLNNKSIRSIKKIKNLENLSYLKKLYLNYNEIEEIEGLDTLVALKSLHLQGNRINKIKNLSNLKDLEFLYLNNNEILVIEGINKLFKLKSLMIFDNYISEIKNLEKLLKLEVLNLRNNQIIEIKGLNKLKNLKRLDLSNNNISEIKNLENLTNLEFLDLSYNKITEIKGLENLSNLKFLDLRHNNLRDIKGLENLKDLRHLYIGFNNIQEMGRFDNLEKSRILDIKNVEEIYIPESNWGLYQEIIKSIDYPSNLAESIRDIKFLPINFNSESIISELSAVDNYIKYLSDSLCMIILKNNAYHIFRLSKFGQIEWVQKSKKLKIE
ncbi:MAG: leucine-rich repeat domain-containing protein [Candidatus Thorarchaeota archaeon]